ncbi:MAG: PIG-L family deacetylase [Aquihabitans sp.]
MSTIVSFHAHPDDESIGTGGLLATAADAGHRVVLVFATRGELGTPVPGVLADGEQLTLRRTAECYDSAAVLGVDRVEFLGYTDSGMMGDDTNDAPWCFWQADVDQAARRLAAVLEEEQPEILTVYDDIGGYGHPDHIQVHRVGRRAAELAGVPVVAQGTINQDHIETAMAMAAEFGIDLDEVDGGASPSEAPSTAGGRDGDHGRSRTVERVQSDTFGKPEAEITHRVDVTAVVDRKRASMRAHASQIGPDHFMVSMPDEAFAYVFGTEWFILDPPVPPNAPEGGLFATLFHPLR